MNQTRTHLDLIDSILTRNIAWIAAADSKVAPILAIDTAMLGVLAALAPISVPWTPLQAAVSAIAGGLLLGSVACLAWAVFPRLDGPKSSFVFFGGIVSQEREAYVTAILNCTPEKLTEDVARQCHRNAEIAAQKFTFVKWSMLLLFIAILPWLGAVAVLYGADAQAAAK